MKKIWIVVLLGALAMGATMVAGAQAAGRPTVADLADFFDTNVPALMEAHHVAGAVVGVADRRGALLLRGYGRADVEQGTPVDPEGTLFRAGSITKLFTWTAIMQLVEQGKLRLEDPVETYLDFDLPHNYPEPIRIVDLMDHNAGFEDRLIGLMVLEAKYRESLKESVSRHIPRRVRPPGREVAYSNYGTMLAGYIVQRISGIPYEEYVARYILEPLGMHHSTLKQPPAPELARGLATGYAYARGTYVAQKFELANCAPAGALSTTAADMLRFYQAYLNGGELDGRRILREQTVRIMREPTFREDPRAAGFAHGFFEIWRGNIMGFGHSGDTMYFHSDSGYFPDADLAYFVSANSAAGMQVTMKLRSLMLDRFFPIPNGGELAQVAGLHPDLRQYTGVFAMNRRSESDPTQIIGALSTIRPKVVEEGGRLRIASMLDPEGSVYVPVAKDIFQQKDGSMRFVFLRDDRGRVRSLYSHEFPAFLFSRPPWIELPAVSLTVLVLGLLFLLTGTIAPPTGLLTLVPRLRWKGGGMVRPLALWSGRAYLLLLLAQVVVVASLGNFMFVPIGPAYALPLYLAAAAAAIMLAVLVLAWRGKLFRLLGRLHYTAFAVSQALFIAWLGYWGFFFV